MKTCRFRMNKWKKYLKMGSYQSGKTLQYEEEPIRLPSTHREQSSQTFSRKIIHEMHCTYFRAVASSLTINILGEQNRITNWVSDWQSSKWYMCYPKVLLPVFSWSASKNSTRRTRYDTMVGQVRTIFVALLRVFSYCKRKRVLICLGCFFSYSITIFYSLKHVDQKGSFTDQWNLLNEIYKCRKMRYENMVIWHFRPVDAGFAFK